MCPTHIPFLTNLYIWENLHIELFCYKGETEFMGAFILIIAALLVHLYYFKKKKPRKKQTLCHVEALMLVKK